ncbi:Trypanosome RHS, partial [Trypanosoma melophagium]|uniref:Trypanosome RHS n=1 Tax=Trypanosoma melophagium TaxID=715481 RepID=UPI003519F925
MPRRTGENDADEPPAVRARVETVTQPKWTLDSTVREVLLHDVNIPETPKLNDFLRNNVGGRGVVDSNENVTMKAFAIDPAMYIQDDELRMLITALSAYKKVLFLIEVANNLEKAEVYYLRQWDEFKNKESILSMARGKLNAALNAAKRQMHVSQDTTPVGVEGVYESVYNATWHYVEGVGGEGFGMQVKEGHPPQTWADDEVMKGSAEDDNDNDNEKPEGGRVYLMVLTSPKGWPYRGFNMCCGHDIYINKEVMRTCHKILKDLDEYFVDNVHANKVLTPYVLIGTPGIGKSFAAGSFLLYQLLHYDAERLPVVAYFTRGGAYLFENNNDGGKVFRYKREENAEDVIEDLSKNKRGYIIYDVSDKSGRLPLSLPPPEWGMVVISSPNEKQYKEWDKQKKALHIIINCPTVRDIKAMCAWRKDYESNKLESYWNSIKGRIDNVGPLPRYIFDDGAYGERRSRVQGGMAKALKGVSGSNVLRLKAILRGDAVWEEYSSTSEILKIYRVVINGCDVPMNAAVNNALYNKIFTEVMGFLHSPTLNSPFIKKGVLNVEKFEEYGVNTFRDRNFVTALSNELKIIQSPGIIEGKRSVLQRRDSVTYASKGCLRFPTGTNDEEMRIEYDMLYHPSVPDFPLVDAFYFVKSAEGRVTLIGIQTTTARDHETTVTAVSKFIKYLKTCFSDWADVSDEVSWEIIYMQPKVGN